MSSFLEAALPLMILLCVLLLIIVTGLSISESVYRQSIERQFCENEGMEYIFGNSCLEQTNGTLIEHPIQYKDGKVYWLKVAEAS